jgi:UDP-N-acetyl-D-glucosamine dehydrogenase
MDITKNHSFLKKEKMDMSFYETLIKKIENKDAVIGVVGLGYVGLPLAVEKAKAGYKVIGFDVQQARVDQVNQGINYIGDVVDQDLVDMIKSGQLQATTDYGSIKEVDAVAICVPTPLDIYQQPDTSYVESSAKEIAKYAHEGMLVVLESTTYPGTTEEIVRPALEAKGLVTGETVFIAYSPERVDPGNKQFKTKNTPKVVGGITANCTKVAASLYRNVLEGDVFEVSSPAIAEMEKIFENTFRHINIALANEMAILCEKMGIDVWEVIDAAKTKPYGYMAFYPGPGLGGHCIPIDPFYLTWKAREYNYHTRLIELAGEINNTMPEYVITRAMQVLNEDGKALRGAKITVLGVAYKKDIDDVRESPVLKIIELLEHHGADYQVVDPYVASFKSCGRVMETVELTKEMLKQSDLVLVATDHTDFDYNMIAKESKVIFDTRNALKDIAKPNKYVKL